MADWLLDQNELAIVRRAYARQMLGRNDQAIGWRSSSATLALFSLAHARLLDVPGGALAARRHGAPAHTLVGPFRIPRHHRAIRPGAGGIERNHQRRGGVMHRAHRGRVMLVMDVTIEHRGLEWLEQLERLVAVRRPPAPRPVELEQWTMGQDDDRRPRRQLTQISGEPGDLRITEFLVRVRGVV